MMAVLILVAIVAFVGVMLFSMTAGFLGGGGRAALVLSATGSGSSDGERATINLVIRNTGDGAAKVVSIYVVPESGGAEPTSMAVPGASFFEATATSERTVPTVPSLPVTTKINREMKTYNIGNIPGIVVDAGSSKTLFLYVEGEGLYTGAQLRIYVVYFDLGSKEGGVVDTVVTLR